MSTLIELVSRGGDIPTPSHVSQAVRKSRTTFPKKFVFDELTTVYSDETLPAGCHLTVISRTLNMAIIGLEDCNLAYNPDQLKQNLVDLFNQLDEAKTFKANFKGNCDTTTYQHYAKRLPKDFCIGKEVDRRPYIWILFQSNPNRLKLTYSVAVGNTVIHVGTHALESVPPSNEVVPTMQLATQ